MFGKSVQNIDVSWNNATGARLNEFITTSPNVKYFISIYINKLVCYRITFCYFTIDYITLK